MRTETNQIQRLLVGQWDLLKTTLRQLSSAAQVQPDDGYRVFQAADSSSANVVRFKFGPAVFNVPERATSPRPQLFVVVEGSISFRRDCFISHKLLTTDNFFTRAAYFRDRESGPDHIYGAHYDFALDELGHPVFHSQMRGFPEMWASVNEHFGTEGEPDDHIRGILRNVRVPTAQMDVFAFFLQLCADHLLSRDSGPDERAAFNKLIEKSSFIRGAGYQSARLKAEAARECYRASHWYPLLA